MANKKKRCKYCKHYFIAEGMIKVPAGIFCTFEHAQEFVIAKTVENQEKEKAKSDAWRKSLPKNKRELDRNDLKWQEDHTQTSFNKMRVQQELLWFYDRGIEPYCISCLKTKMDFCCGHHKTRGSNSFLQFDENNTFLQCNKYCNMSLSGNIIGTSTTIGYIAGLKHRFGDDEAYKIIGYCENSPTSIKRTKEDYEALRKSYNAEYRRLVPLVEQSKMAYYATC